MISLHCSERYDITFMGCNIEYQTTISKAIQGQPTHTENHLNPCEDVSQSSENDPRRSDGFRR